MERKVGEEFEYKGHKLKVVMSNGSCAYKDSPEKRCFFDHNCNISTDIAGYCAVNSRLKNKDCVCFIEITEKDNNMERLDLTKLLKPGMKIYSSIEGETTVTSISRDVYPITTKNGDRDSFCYTRDGHYLNTYEGECVLFPSKDIRDWNKVNILKLLEPKKGDYLVSRCNECIFIYNGNYNGDSYGYVVSENSKDTKELDFAKFNYYSANARYATEDEIKSFNEKLKANGYMFDRQTLELKKIKWRGDLGDNYWYITTDGNIEWSKEMGVGSDNYRYEFGNYFKTKEEAEVFAKQFRNILNEYHNGRKVC